MKRLYLAMFFVILLMGIVSSSISKLPTPIIQNQSIDLPQVSSLATYENITTLQLPNTTIITLNVAMTKSGSNFNYTLSSQYTNLIGEYIINGCSDDTDNPCWSYSFEVTPNGQNFTTGKAISYIGFIIILLFIFILTIFGAFKVNWKHQRNEEDQVISINNFRYIKVFLFSMAYLEIMFLSGLSYKFFSEANIQGFTSFFNFVYQWFLNLLYPTMIFMIVVFFIIWINNKKLQKKMKLGI